MRGYREGQVEFQFQGQRNRSVVIEEREPDGVVVLSKVVGGLPPLSPKYLQNFDRVVVGGAGHRGDLWARWCCTNKRGAADWPLICACIIPY